VGFLGVLTELDHAETSLVAKAEIGPFDPDAKSDTASSNCKFEIASKYLIAACSITSSMSANIGSAIDQAIHELGLEQKRERLRAETSPDLD
jgi:hypothetical protein